MFCAAGSPLGLIQQSPELLVKKGDLPAIRVVGETRPKRFRWDVRSVWIVKVHPYKPGFRQLPHVPDRRVDDLRGSPFDVLERFA